MLLTLYSYCNVFKYKCKQCVTLPKSCFIAEIPNFLKLFVFHRTVFKHFKQIILYNLCLKKKLILSLSITSTITVNIGSTSVHLENCMNQFVSLW